jgi:TrpR-related protein YerC/YecD
MLSNDNSIWRLQQPRQLAEVLLRVDSITDMQNFLRDVMTQKEILEISARFEAAKMLQNGIKYTEIVAKTKLSSRTVARISDWLQNGSGGYNSVLKQITTHSHIPPASAD